MEIRHVTGPVLAATIDANIWYKDFPRFLIFHLQILQACEFHWSDIIWEECESNLRRPPTSLDDRQLDHVYALMVSTMGECHNLDTPEHSEQIAEIDLSDPKDNHVLYLAYLTDSYYLVTENLKHFPAEIAIRNKLRKVLSLDDFLCEMLEKFESPLINAISRTITDMKKTTTNCDRNFERSRNQKRMPKDSQETRPLYSLYRSQSRFTKRQTILALRIFQSNVLGPGWLSE